MVVNANFSICFCIFENSKYFLEFQCNEDISYGDEMLHIIGHYTNCKEDHMHKYLTDWMESHRYFAERVGDDLICRKGLTVEDYITM